MSGKSPLKFETFIEQFPRRLEKALSGFRVIRRLGDELEYEYQGFDNALDLKIVYEKFHEINADLASLVARYADYVRQFAEKSRLPQATATAVQHYNGYSEKEADWFEKAAAERRQRLQLAAPPPPPPPVSTPSNRHPKVIKVKPRRAPRLLVQPPPPPAAVPPASGKSGNGSHPAPSRKRAAPAARKAAKGASARKSPKRAPVKAKRPASKPAGRKRAKAAAKPRFMDRVKKLFGR
ncbi:MAG: hypothetical protein KIT79_07455 [Deltaproteobacteria bacterium]|nr:hypothetical protein [Deltaproteobacteria bacterium]